MGKEKVGLSLGRGVLQVPILPGDWESAFSSFRIKITRLKGDEWHNSVSRAMIENIGN
jgi:hypothetical protein